MGPSHQSKGPSQFPPHDLVVTQPDVSGRPNVSVDGETNNTYQTLTLALRRHSETA